MSSIDWSKAPSWADRVLAMGMTGAWAWASERQYQYIGKINKEIFLYEEENTWKLSDGELVEMRNSVDPWQGTGLPPVGTVCWVKRVSGQDSPYEGECEIIAHHMNGSNPVAVYVRGPAKNMYVSMAMESCFSVIRTQEQIEAEEIEANAKGLFSLLHPEGKWHKLHEESKDRYRMACQAGYRKQPKEDA